MPATSYEKRLEEALRAILPLAKSMVPQLEHRADSGQISEKVLQAATDKLKNVDALLAEVADRPTLGIWPPSGIELFQLADDEDTYGADAGRYILVDKTGDKELSGAMNRDDADRMVRLLGVVELLGQRALDGSRYGPDMHGSAVSVLRDIASTAQRTLDSVDGVPEPIRSDAPAGMAP